MEIQRKGIPDPLEEVIKRLPRDIKAETLDFAEFLMNRRRKPMRRPLRRSWAGGIKENTNKFTSLQLRKRALDRRHVR